MAAQQQSELSSTAVLRALLKSPLERLRVRLGDSTQELVVVAVEHDRRGPVLVAVVAPPEEEGLFDA